MPKTRALHEAGKRLKTIRFKDGGKIVFGDYRDYPAITLYDRQGKIVQTIGYAVLDKINKRRRILEGTTAVSSCGRWIYDRKKGRVK